MSDDSKPITSDFKQMKPTETQTIIQHRTNPQDFVNDVAEALFTNYLRPFVEQLSIAKPENKLFTRGQTAKKLNIALSSLNEYTKTGKIKGRRIGARVLYSEQDINDALTTIKTK